MDSSDPMGESPGRILLNGNAETLDRLVDLADRTLGPPRHRDPLVRERAGVLLCTAAWGDGELREGPLRAAIGARGRPVENLGIHTAMREFLGVRDVVRTLYEEHEAIWRELYQSYSEENDETVSRLRKIWARVQGKLPSVSMSDLLSSGGELPPGPRTRPTHVFLKTAWGAEIRRAIADLWEADERHAVALRTLWTHFHLAAGIEYDPLWAELRSRMAVRILRSTAVILPGGSPTLLLLGFRFFQLDGVLTEALRRGTCFFGTSAGAMALGRRVVVFNDKRTPRQEFQLLENGLRLVEGIQAFPHVTDRVQTDDPANLAYLAARFRHRACVGLNAGSVLELEPAGGRWKARSVGDEDVVVFGQTGEKRRYPGGTEVSDIQ